MRAIDIFKLLGKVSVDTGDTEKKLSKVSKAFSAVGKGAIAVGKTIGVGLATGATAIGGLTVKALNLSGELEQNMGGSEAVFGKYANKMQETAKSAFSNMGLSTSDYLATANKMGALFQGAGFDIEESMNLSQDAMQRAADVASIMGLDTSAAMEAVAGAAKGNFTMMDNLGVAMNETTLANYALEKGMKKSYKEMTQQEKIGVAMEMFLDKTAYAAGNYAKENETLAGSLGTAKAALTNFLDGSGDVDSLVNAFSNAANVIVDNLKTIAPRLVSGITDIVNQIMPMIPPILNDLLPVIVEGAVSLINGLVAALPGVIDALMNVLPALTEGLMQITMGLIEALPAVLESLITGIVNILPTLLPMLIDAVTALVVSLCSSFSDIIQPIIDALPEIIISVTEALMNNLPALIDGAIQLTLGIVEALPKIIQALVDATPKVISMILTGLYKAVPQLIAGLTKVFTETKKSLPQILKSLVEGIINTFKGIWDAIKNIFGVLDDWFGKKFKQGADNAKKAWESIANFFSSIRKGIEKVFSAIGSWFGKQFEQGRKNAQQAFSTLGNFFKNIWSGIQTVFSNVGGWFRDKFNSAKNGIQNAWSGVRNFFSNIKNGIVNAFSNVKEKLTQPFTKARDAIKGVVDKIKGFFSNLKFRFPKIKLPKFSVKPAGWKIGDLLKGTVPKLGVTWAAKGGIFDEPTLFDTPTGALGVGEAGAEAVAPIDTLMGYVETAVKNETNGLAARIDDLIGMLGAFFPQILTATERPIVLDDGTLVGRIAPKMNAKLGEIQNANARGR